jgi:T5SS/PEP-CTERM-associated repeat protein/autotransporter-associated beta strand protein
MKLFRVALVLFVLLGSAGAASAQTATLGYNWQGATLNNEGSGWPPDTNGSVGINQFVQAVNGGYQMYNKDGTGYTFPTNYISNNSFWTNKVGLTTGSTSYSDPRIYYDPLSQRWFAAELTTNVSTNNKILIGRSDTSDPRGTWHGVIFNSATNLFADYPVIGVDANGVYVGTNDFTTTSLSGVSFISVPKAQFMAATTTTALSQVVANSSVNHGLSTSNTGFTPTGVTDTTGATIGTTTGLVFGDRTNTTLAIRTISNPANAGATLGSSTSLTITSAPDPGSFSQQMGTTNTLDNGDGRLGSGVFRVGNLVFLSRTVNSIDGQNHSAIRWSVLSVNPSTNAVAVVREGTVNVSGVYLSYPSIAVNTRGDFVLSFSRSASTEFPSIWAVVGTTTDFSNWSVGAPFQLQAGLTFQNIGTGGNNRWGDYSSTSLDPSDPGSFWVTNEYMPNVDPPGSINANNNWGTRVVEVIPTIAGEVRWKNAAAGPFSTPANWQTGVAPGSTDHVIFSRWSGSSYTVSVADGTTNDRLSIRQTGTGTLTFNIPSGATWSLTNASATTPSLAVSEFQGQSNVFFSGGGTLLTKFAIIAGQAGGTGNVTVTGAGTLWNNQNDLYLGGTSTAAGGTGTLSVSNGATVQVGGTLKIWQGDGTTTQVSVSGAGTTSATLQVAGLTNATGTTPRIDLASATSSLIVSDGLGTSFGGTITGAGQVVKQGTGTFTLTGANTYSGATTISGTGTLALSGSGSVAASRPITVGTGATLSVSGVTGGANFDTTTAQFALASGQTLQGTGTVSGGVTVRPGAGIRGDTGTGTGTLTVAGGLVLQGASGSGGATLTTAVTDNGTLNPNHSIVTATTLNLTIDSVNKLNLILIQGAPPLPQGQQYTATLATTTGGIQLNGVAQSAGTIFDPTTYTLTAQGVVISPVFQLAVDGTGQSLVLTFTPVPEPATALGLAAAGLGFVGLVRRRPRVRC